MKKIFVLANLLVHLSKSAQIKFEVKFSKPIAMLEFFRNVSGKRGPNSFTKIFNTSEFNNAKYEGLLTALASIHINYDQPFQDYPFSQKWAGNKIHHK